MDSGNSSSMQSSSGGCGGGGGEEEYDSRTADQSISAFFDQHVSSLEMKRNSGFSAAVPQQNQLFHFDHSNNNSLLPPNYFNNNGFLPSDIPISQPDFRAISAATSSLPPPNNNNMGVVTKKTKKRSRASRRAPTTVLTTDTSNFRAMVQEFTGIPSPPLFNVNNSVVNTTRLNTFLGLSSSSSSSLNNNLLLRPFAHKLLPTTSNLLSSTSQIHQQQQYQNPNNGFGNMNLQSLLQAQISSSNPNRSNDQFALGMLQNPTTTHAPPVTTTTTVANGENGNFGGADQDHNNDGTWLCSSSDQRT